MPQRHPGPVCIFSGRPHRQQQAPPEPKQQLWQREIVRAPETPWRVDPAIDDHHVLLRYIPAVFCRARYVAAGVSPTVDRASLAGDFGVLLPCRISRRGSGAGSSTRTLPIETGGSFRNSTTKNGPAQERYRQEKSGVLSS